jgi:hypothetical protein
MRRRLRNLCVFQSSSGPAGQPSIHVPGAEKKDGDFIFLKSRLFACKW